jgi:hypothetical protein
MRETPLVRDSGWSMDAPTTPLTPERVVTSGDAFTVNAVLGDIPQERRSAVPA